MKFKNLKPAVNDSFPFDVQVMINVSLCDIYVPFPRSMSLFCISQIKTATGYCQVVM